MKRKPKQAIVAKPTRRKTRPPALQAQPQPEVQAEVPSKAQPEVQSKVQPEVQPEVQSEVHSMVPSPGVAVTGALVESPVPHLLVRVVGVLDESSVEDFFKRVSEEVTAAKAKGVLVDLRECRVTLSISDMHGLVKMVARGFSGTVDRLSLLMQERDILPEKFFEPALTSRGLPTLASADPEEAVYWLSTKLRL